MRLISSIPRLRRWIAQTRRAGKKIGFVPTMGALHEGHLSLIRRARQAVGPRGAVVVSLFVNPTQFNQKSDFNRYPHRLAMDAAMCRKAGVNLIFSPTAAAMYPPDFSTWIEEKSLSLPLCGASRPGHFRGVCTVVMKLFNLVQPNVAVFGQKDAQQAMVIRRMVQDLNCPVQVMIAPTVRESDGLAMSSRNQRLNAVERKLARALNEALRLARSAFQKGCRNATKLRLLARRHLRSVPSLRLDYLELVNGSILRPVRRSEDAKKGDLLAVAAFVGKTRLIDNVRL